MKKTLVELPDAKFIKQNEVLQVGKEYKVVGEFQNSCFIIEHNNDKFMILKSRFE